MSAAVTWPSFLFFFIFIIQILVWLSVLSHNILSNRFSYTVGLFVNISSGPLGWVDVILSSLQEWGKKDQPNVQGPKPKCFKQ